MRPTKTIIGKKSLEAITKGVNAIYIPVSKTLGPNGKNALLYRSYNRGSRITNDGYTVAEVQEPKNPFVRLVALTFKEMCKKTNEKIGDGTTGTAVIGGILWNKVYKLLSEGQSEFTAKKSGQVSVIAIKRKILETAKIVKKKIREVAKKIETLEDLEKIAVVSVEDEKLGKVVAKMAWDVGMDGYIDVVEGYKGEIETEVIKGMRFPAKIADKAFLTNKEKFEMIAQDSHILITNYALDNTGMISAPFQEISKKTTKLIVVAPSFSENVLVNMIKAIKNGFFIYPVFAPSMRTEQMEDLAVYCKANLIDKHKGKLFKNITFEDLGWLEKLVVKDTEAKEEAVALGGRGAIEEKQMSYGKIDVEENGQTKKKNVMAETITSPVQERIEILKGQLAETRQDQYKKLMQRRIASMASAVGVIRVGDSTQASALYLKLKLDDAVYACKAALKGGYVKGGGLCLKEIADKLEDDILKPALLAPYEQIQASAEDGVEITDNIIDPADAVYYAVEHATQVVANLITVDVITPEVDDIPPGDGYLAMARALGEMSISLRRHFGQLKENEEEMARDKMERFILTGELETDELVEVSGHSDW